MATTFVHRGVAPTALSDLKHLLVEAKQRVPPFLKHVPDQEQGEGGCAFCGGLGHRIGNCPKLEQQGRQLRGAQRDLIGGSW